MVSDTEEKVNINKKAATFIRDPRIVRVSRAFGGKDRHSKVSTIRGLRDRRVRLSVPTAIQLYDLQDRLGLNQPSKVVDWLLNAAQHEINKLPPLDFIQFHQSLDEANYSKANYDHQCFNVEGEQLAFPIYNAEFPFHEDYNYMMCSNNSRGGGEGEQALGLISNGGFPNCQWDQSNKSGYNNFSQFGIISSQVDVASASVLSSLDGISAQQINLPLNGNAMSRNSFISGTPKTI